MNDIFAFRLVNENGVVLGMRIPDNSPAFMDVLNTLCGAHPVEWIGNNSHDKIICCTPQLKNCINGIGTRFAVSIPAIIQLSKFFNNQADNSFVAFLRERCCRSEIKLENGKWITNEEYWNTQIGKAIEKIRGHKLKSYYNVVTFGDTNEEVFTGPELLRECVCRFCGETSIKKFKKRNAHAIPEALGNTLIFCNDECVVCNDKLSRVDKELTEYLKYRRSENKIRNKRNKIIQVHGQNFEYNGITDELKISKDAILKEEGNRYFLKLLGADPISHTGIYKGLTKIAIDLMPRDMVARYDTAVRWIRGEFIPYKHKLPDVYYAYWEKSIEQPVAHLFIRKSEHPESILPRCMAAIRFMDLTFFFIVPFENDEREFAKDEVNKYVNDLIYCVRAEETPFNLETIEMDDRIGKFAHVTIWCNKSDCQLVDKTELKAPQEKNPNIVAFPPLDKSKVTLKSVEFFVSADIETNTIINRLRIEESYIEILDDSMQSIPNTTDFESSWNFKICNIFNPADNLQVILEVTASHSVPDEVCSVETNELSSELNYYMLQYGCASIKKAIGKKMPFYDFDNLAEFLMENEGRIMNPKV